MKKILLLIISILIVSCGSRKKELEKQYNEAVAKSNANLQQSSAYSNTSQGTTDLSKFLSDKGLKIISDGKPYELKYGDLVFSGSANMEFSEKKENTKIQYKYYNHTTYQTKTQYKTQTTYKTVIKYKNLKTEREGYPFWIFILIGFLGNILLKFLWSKLKQSTWHLKIWEQLNKKR